MCYNKNRKGVRRINICKIIRRTKFYYSDQARNLLLDFENDEREVFFINIIMRCAESLTKDSDTMYKKIFVIRVRNRITDQAFLLSARPIILRDEKGNPQLYVVISEDEEKDRACLAFLDEISKSK